MGRQCLLPLELADCLTDSPYFRQNLHAYEKELENTSSSIKSLVKDIKEVLDAAKREYSQFNNQSFLVMLLKVWLHGTVFRFYILQVFGFSVSFLQFFSFSSFCFEC